MTIAYQIAGESKSATFKIWMAGDIKAGEACVREFCYNEGACFAIQAAEFVYTAGQESGFAVTRINYARFPVDESAIFEQCVRLAAKLARALHQKSCSIEGPRETFYLTFDVPALRTAT